MEEISSFCKKVEVSKARCDCVVNYSKGQINTQGDPATGIVRAQPRRHDSEVENRLEGARICGSYPSDREGWRCLLRDRWMDIVEIFSPRGGRCVAPWLCGPLRPCCSSCPLGGIRRPSPLGSSCPFLPFPSPVLGSPVSVPCLGWCWGPRGGVFGCASVAPLSQNLTRTRS